MRISSASLFFRLFCDFWYFIPFFSPDTIRIILPCIRYPTVLIPLFLLLPASSWWFRTLPFSPIICPVTNNTLVRRDISRRCFLSFGCFLFITFYLIQIKAELLLWLKLCIQIFLAGWRNHL